MYPLFSLKYKLLKQEKRCSPRVLKLGLTHC